MKKILLSVGAIIAMSSLGFADEATEDESFYLGLAYTHLSHDADHRGGTIVSEMDFSAVTLQAGYKFNPYVAVEGRYGFSLGDSSDSGLTIDDAEIGVWGIYVKPMYPVSPEFDIYALLGYAGTKAEDRNNVLEVDESGFSWGVGAAYSVTEEFSVFADYVLFYDDSSVRYDHVIDGFNFGVSYQF